MFELWLLCGLLTCIGFLYWAGPGNRLKDLKKYWHYYCLALAIGPIGFLFILMMLAED